MDRKPQKQTEVPLKDRTSILIVDDDPTILHLLRKVFSGRGFQVSVAENGLEALENIRSERPALVITDLKMPFLSGGNLISAMRQASNGLPIIIMTAYPNLYPEKKGDQDIKAYFRKPFDIDEMISSVEKILGNL